MRTKQQTFFEQTDKQIDDICINIGHKKNIDKIPVMEQVKNSVDGHIHNFFKAFDTEYIPDNKPVLTGEYYGFLGYNEYYVVFGVNCRKFTRVFAPDLQTAKNNLTQNQKATLQSITRVNIGKKIC